VNNTPPVKAVLNRFRQHQRKARPSGHRDRAVRARLLVKGRVQGMHDRNQDAGAIATAVNPE
jgi:hypothetical protein